MLFWKYAENLQENTHAEVQFQFPLQLHTSAPEFSCNFTSYFPNAFSSEHLWRTAFLCLKTYFNDAKKWLALEWFARNALYYFDLKLIFISFYNNVKKSLVKNWFCFYFFLWPLAISILTHRPELISEKVRQTVLKLHRKTVVECFYVS